jgi:hypothetical protein
MTKAGAFAFLKSFETKNERKVEPFRLSQFTELVRNRINGTRTESTTSSDSKGRKHQCSNASTNYEISPSQSTQKVAESVDKTAYNG